MDSREKLTTTTIKAVLDSFDEHDPDGDLYEFDKKIKYAVHQGYDAALSLFQWKDVAEGLPEVEGLYIAKDVDDRFPMLIPFRAAIPDRWKHVIAYIPHPIPPYEKKPENG